MHLNKAGHLKEKFKIPLSFYVLKKYATVTKLHPTSFVKRRALGFLLLSAIG